MTHDQLEQPSQPIPSSAQHMDTLLPQLRAYFSTLPEVRLAYYQPHPADEP